MFLEPNKRQTSYHLIKQDASKCEKEDTIVVLNSKGKHER